MNNKKSNEIIHKLFLLNVLIIGLIILLTLTTAHYFPPAPTKSNLLLPQFMSFVQPKPIERSIFFISISVLSLFSLGYILLNGLQYNSPSKKQNKLDVVDNTSFQAAYPGACLSVREGLLDPQVYCKQTNRPGLRKQVAEYRALNYQQTLVCKIIPLVIGTVFFLCLLGSDWIDLIFKGFLVTSHTFIWLMVFLSISFILSFLLSKKVFKKRHTLDPCYSKIINWILFLSAVPFILFSWRIVSIQSIDHTWRNAYHLDAILYPLSQIIRGKTILVDLPSQYGLFPHLIAPIFKVIGLSVFKFSLIMAMLQIIALIAVFYVLNKLINTQILVFLGGLTLIILTGENELYLSGYSDPYYQYWPIRFFWPAVSVFFFYWFCNKKSLIKSIIVSLISSIAIIWNLDTGLFIFISYCAYLCSRYFFCLIDDSTVNTFSPKWHKTDFVSALVIHFVTFICTIFLFAVYLKISSNQPLHYSWVYSYQAIFYKLGLNMLPMPQTLHPWMLIIAIYIYGLIFSLNSFKNRPTYKTELIFYLSILGVGLFTYYEGRSHVLNLFKVMWPAIIISLFFADQTIRGIRVKLINSMNLIFPIEIICVLLLCSALFASNIFTIYTNLNQQIVSKGTFLSPLTLSELQFIRQNTHKGQQCLLLIKNQASYYIESELVSPIKGPGLVETLLKSELASLISQILNTQPQCVFLGVNESEMNIGVNYDEIFKQYSLIKKNKENTIHFLQPKQLFMA